MTEALIKLDVTLPNLALAPADQLSVWRMALLAVEKKAKAANAKLKAAIESRIDGGVDVPGFYVDVTKPRRCVDLANLYHLCSDAGMDDDTFYSCLTLGMDKIEKAYAALMRDAHDMSKVNAVAEFRVKTGDAKLIVEGAEQRSLKQM